MITRWLTLALLLLLAAGCGAVTQPQQVSPNVQSETGHVDSGGGGGGGGSM